MSKFYTEHQVLRLDSVTLLVECAARGINTEGLLELEVRAALARAIHRPSTPIITTAAPPSLSPPSEAAATAGGPDQPDNGFFFLFFFKLSHTPSNRSNRFKTTYRFREHASGVAFDA